MAEDLTRPIDDDAAEPQAAPESAPAHVVEAQAAESPPALAAAPQTADPGRRGVLLGRFRLVYAVLSLVVGAAVGGVIVLTGHGGQASGPPWSAWKPAGGSSDAMQNIATHVSRQYRLDGGARLVSVSAERPPKVPIQDLPVKYVVLSSGGSNANQILLSADNTVAYDLCGDVRQACSIETGAPTVERGQLIRREALELALYTLKYVSGTDSVVALLPPKPNSQTRFALFFTKKSLESALDKPLVRTLPTHRRLTPSTLAASDTTVVRRYADPNVFQYAFLSGRDGSVFLALQPPQLTTQSSGSSGSGSSTSSG